MIMAKHADVYHVLLECSKQRRVSPHCCPWLDPFGSIWLADSRRAKACGISAPRARFAAPLYSACKSVLAVCSPLSKS